ncbi:hypothetical protein [Terrarubrum flagellatum]|uniref:hypothetical protein n=1 Tax=Terrirubrum flagellatum TaxID=2895980 RepID=UPI003144FCD6
MNIPPAFPKMGAWFDTEVRDMIREGEDVFSFALRHIDDHEKQEVKTFLIEVLATVHDPKELQRLWRHAQSRIVIPDDRHLRALLQEIVNRIG